MAGSPRARARCSARHAGETIAAGGKRLRPLLVCIAAGVPAPENDELVRAAVAVELVHAATLVHDDVIDGSPLRRGPPDRGRHRRTADGARDRRPAVLAGLRRAGCGRLARADPGPVARGSALAAGELMQRDDSWDAAWR